MLLGKGHHGGVGARLDGNDEGLVAAHGTQGSLHGALVGADEHQWHSRGRLGGGRRCGHIAGGVPDCHGVHALLAANAVEDQALDLGGLGLDGTLVPSVLHHAH